MKTIDVALKITLCLLANSNLSFEYPPPITVAIGIDLFLKNSRTVISLFKIPSVVICKFPNLSFLWISTPVSKITNSGLKFFKQL